jgi:hypothetical protein
VVNIKNNPPFRTFLIWTGVAVLGIFIIFIPRLIGLEGFKGGFALSLLGGFMAVAGIIAALIFLRLAVYLGRITQKEHLLAHWTYAPEQWKGYTEREHTEDVSAKKGTFVMIAIISVIVGLIFWVIQRGNPLVIVLIVLGIIAASGLAAFFSARSNYRRNKKFLGEAYISLDGVYLNRQIHIWNGIGNHLENAAYDDSLPAEPRMIFRYSSPGRGERYYYTARIPVPPGQEEAARTIIAKIDQAQLSKTGKGA